RRRSSPTSSTPAARRPPWRPTHWGAWRTWSSDGRTEHPLPVGIGARVCHGPRPTPPLAPPHTPGPPGPAPGPPTYSSIGAAALTVTNRPNIHSISTVAPAPATHRV